MRGKKGSHVGVVLSFVIFIAFLIFIFTVLQPKLNLTGEDKQSIADYLRVELLNNFTSNLTTVFINVTSSNNPNQACIKLIDLIYNVSIIPKIIVQNETNANLSARVVGNDLDINRDNLDNRFFKVYSSAYFNDITNTQDFSNCKELYLDSDYSVNLKETEAFVFENLINSTIQSYKSDYPSLKTAFNIPSDSEFGIIFKNADGVINQPNFNVTQNSNVYSDDVPILYVGKDGNIKSGSLQILVW
ncbi:MAG TPA: hypothetical protein VMC80_01200 [Patescibacteria group bacterium]|nr:hypothetical protein [Patescibacteria group bacterium]